MVVEGRGWIWEDNDLGSDDGGILITISHHSLGDKCSNPN